MKRFFENSKSLWVRYSEYVIAEDAGGIRYLKAAPEAMPDP